MLTELFAVIAPILICASIGVVWARSDTPYPAEFVTRAVMNIGAPCLMVSAFGQVDVDAQALARVAGVACVVMLTLMALGLILIRFWRLSVPTYLPPLLFPNNGNMGLPLCLFAFGEQGLAMALGYFLIMMVSHITLGIFIVSSASGAIMARLKEMARQPILYAGAIALLMLVTGWRLPKWLDNTVGLLAGFTIPLMLITLGVSLASLKISGLQRGLVFSLLRVGGGFTIAWFACEWLALEGVARGVALLQASMPVAVFNYLFAHRYRRNPEEVAGMVVVSTLLAFAVSPFLLSYLLG